MKNEAIIIGGGKIPEWLILAVWTLFFMLPFLGLRDLWLPDDARYAEVAREMLESGDWLTPRLNGLPHMTKPPLTYWLIAASMAVFGENEFAARLVNALVFCGVVVATYFLAKEFNRPRSAFWAGAILLTSPIPAAGAHVITTDMLLTLWICLSIYLFWGWHQRRPWARVRLVAAYGVLGLAFLTKGPVGVLVPLLVLLGFSLFTRNRHFFRQGISGGGLCLFLLVAAPWYVSVLLDHEGLLQYYLGNELAGRIFSTVHNRDNPFLMYPLELIAGILPWTVFQFTALKEAFTWQKIKNRRLPEVEALLLSWILLPMIFFSLIRSRLPLYILSLFIPMAILIAGRLFPEQEGAGGKDAFHKGHTGRRVLRMAVITSLVLMGLNIGAAFVPTAKNIYPIVEKIQSIAASDDYRLYANRDYLYALNFYLKKKVIVTHEFGDFTADPGPAFLVAKFNKQPFGIPENIRGKAELIFEYYHYQVYYRRL